MTLAELPVLVLDCQSTGNAPAIDRLLEIAWQPARACGPSAETVSFLLQQPPGAVVPRRIARLTGIDEAALQEGLPPEAAWLQLVKACADTAAGRTRPLVIHYARFETAFLTPLARSTGTGMPLLRQVICTHEITRRLLPWLPRKGLRAVAGYFGHSVPVVKRAGPHVQATGVIWKHLVDLLAAEGIQSPASLRRWLSRSPRGNVRRRYPMPDLLRRSVPDRPGVYCMRRSNGDLLYVGKAGSLKKRVRTYFQASRRHSEAVLEMLTQAVDLRVTVTASALEAALLEAAEIKRGRPPYNQALQVGERRLCFCSRDFARMAAEVDRVCSLGPVPDGRRYEALHRIGVALLGPPGRRWTENRRDLLVLTADQRLPDASSFEEGWRHFRKRYAGRCRHQTPWRALLAAGARIWHQRRLAPETPEEAGCANAEGWDGESVLRHLESLVAQCAHQLRRARWFAMLCESSLAWEVDDDGGWRVLVFCGGRLDCCRGADPAAIPPVPPGWRRTQIQRKRCLDLECYDRLRVLTTELRRILAAGRGLHLRLGKKVVLDATRVAAVLRWI